MSFEMFVKKGRSVFRADSLHVKNIMNDMPYAPFMRNDIIDWQHAKVVLLFITLIGQSYFRRENVVKVKV